MTWKDSMEIGVPEIDNQHKELCGILDDFYAASVQGKGDREVMRLLDYLASYTLRHFADEEKLMSTISYPRYEKHKAQHDEMRIKVAGMKEEITKWGASTTLVKSVNEAITTWLIRHIMGFDTDIKKYII